MCGLQEAGSFDEIAVGAEHLVDCGIVVPRDPLVVSIAALATLRAEYLASVGGAVIVDVIEAEGFNGGVAAESATWRIGDGVVGENAELEFAPFAESDFVGAESIGGHPLSVDGIHVFPVALAPRLAARPSPFWMALAIAAVVLGGISH